MELKEKQLRVIYGVDKLNMLNELSSDFQELNERKALRYAKQAASLADNLKNEDNSLPTNSSIAQAYEQMATINLSRGKYFEFAKNVEALKSVQSFLRDSMLHKRIMDYDFKIDSLDALGEIKSGFINRTLSKIKVGEAIRNESNDLRLKSKLNQATSKEESGDFLAAIANYEEAINLYRNSGERVEINKLRLKIATLYDSLNMHKTGQAYLEEVLKEKNPSSTKEEVIPNFSNLSSVSRDSLQNVQKKYQGLAKKFENEKDFNRSLRYYDLYQQVTQKLFEDSIAAIAQNKINENEITLLTQQKNIAALKLEKSKAENVRQIQLKRTYLIIGLLALVSAIIGGSLFLSKRKKHKKLTIAYTDLDVANVKLKQAESRITTLLQQQVSDVAANELLKAGDKYSGESNTVCVLFLDIRGFTKIAQVLSPEKLIEFQNEAFGPMLDSIQKNGGMVNQLMGDGFMATFGIGNKEKDFCVRAFESAIEILEALQGRILKKEIRNFEIGIGLHTGDVVVGNVGNDSRKQFSITGNPVIIASRLEQLNKKYQSNLIVSDEVYANISRIITDEQFETEVVNLKGRNDRFKIHILKG
ncbi:adenylate/guanylate cyclase domain-containing protein [Croceivirga thetidis]|uniref:Adenylate/guanylate cyclase domain-containing protein n=1 Tax=Croceivirga thetidis TaxID=2721623 RepID=A0ABX1GU13_9FLAO|nr:adenylate/guanylate cyclase domain-containing protein [Croceivirga thetidis]NKI32511.1 adenylate/guanylate cyclase domain-containing protein [Croceivirga thetidis]